MQLSWATPNPGSSNTGRLHHAVSVQPCRDRSLYLRCPGGEVSATSALAFKIGPLGLSPKKFDDDLTKATSD